MPKTPTPTQAALADAVIAYMVRFRPAATLHELADFFAGRLTRAELRQALDLLAADGRIRLAPRAGVVGVEVIEAAADTAPLEIVSINRATARA